MKKLESIIHLKLASLKMFDTSLRLPNINHLYIRLFTAERVFLSALCEVVNNLFAMSMRFIQS